MSAPDPTASLSPEELIAVIKRGLDADEQTARECAGAPWSTPIPGQVHVEAKAIADNKLALGRLGYVATVLHEHDRQHIARHDPSRVLADVESKQGILAWHRAERNATTPLGEPVQICRCGYDLPCATLRALARPYLAQETP